MSIRAGRVRSALLVLMVVAVVAVPVHALAQAVVSGFEGSTELGVYESEFEVLAYATEVAMEPNVRQVEGSLLSRVFEKPEGRSNLEVFRSYERELVAEGFTIHLAAEPSTATGWMVKQLYDPPNTASFTRRPYERPNGDGRVAGMDLGFISGTADYYIVASRVRGDAELWVAVVISKSRPTYMVEELTTAAMETGTVVLDIDAMRSAMDETGKVAVYGILFATGSATIAPESADTLGVIATYLRDTGDSVYIVGHTDDTGTLAGNLTLSEQRAAAVRQALITAHDIDAELLETRGVGPLAPVASNENDPGRALNRRVEIVRRLR